MRRLAFVTSFIVVVLFAIPIVGAILAAILGNLVNNVAAILLLSFAWYAAVLMVLRIRARRRKLFQLSQYAAILVLLLNILVCGSAQAGDSSEEGWEQFGVGLLPADHVGSDGSWRIMVSTWSESDSLHGTVATVLLEPGPNLECATEDRTKTVPLGPTGAGHVSWPVRFVTKGDGPRRIVATIRIGRPGGPAIDEQEVRLDVTIHEGLVQVERQDKIRTTRVERGQRFRYGGRYLVAIDESETVHPRIDVRPSIKREYVARCPSCAAESDKVDLVVTVGRNGRVTWIQPRRPWNSNIAPELLEAAIQGAKRWRFEPARSNGKPVADWATISVIVRRG
ncbi:MAG TPA: hypothetical protein VEU09_06105 [Candidatus Binatia bacterium]|nr:hypothetical protein [Candidatus Binatia bacterium]